MTLELNVTQLEVILERAQTHNLKKVADTIKIEEVNLLGTFLVEMKNRRFLINAAGITMEV